MKTNFLEKRYVPMMIIFILVGGLGTRLRSVIKDIPKPLAPVNKKAFLDYQILEIKKYFPKNRIYLLTCYKSEKIEEYYKNDDDIIIIQENELLGTGGSVKNAIKSLGLLNNTKLLVLNGDTYLEADLKEFVSNPIKDISIICSFQNDCSRYGSLEIKDNLIFNFKEKNIDFKDNYINAGCYFFDNLNFFDNKRIEKKKFSLEEEFSNYLNNDTIGSFKYSGVFIDIGVPDDYEKMKKFIDNKYE